MGKDIFVDTWMRIFINGCQNAEMTFGLGKMALNFLILRNRNKDYLTGQLVNLVKLPSDAILGNSVNFETILGAVLEINVNSNLGKADILTLQDTAGVTLINVVSYTFNPHSG